MTRFWFLMKDAINFVDHSFKEMKGVEIFVPKIPSFKVIDVARVVCPGIPIHVIGIRPGEKLNEIMITEDDSNYTYEFDDHFAILSPSLLASGVYKDLGKKVSEGFNFYSDNNQVWHTDESFLKLLKEHGILK